MAATGFVMPQGPARSEVTRYQPPMSTPGGAASAPAGEPLPSPPESQPGPTVTSTIPVTRAARRRHGCLSMVVTTATRVTPDTVAPPSVRFAGLRAGPGIDPGHTDNRARSTTVIMI